MECSPLDPSKTKEEDAESKATAAAVEDPTAPDVDHIEDPVQIYPRRERLRRRVFDFLSLQARGDDRAALSGRNTEMVCVV